MNPRSFSNARGKVASRNDARIDVRESPSVENEFSRDTTEGEFDEAAPPSYVDTTLPLSIYHLFTTHFRASDRSGWQRGEELKRLPPLARRNDRRMWHFNICAALFSYRLIDV